MKTSIQRSKLRLLLGKFYYQIKRYLEWYLSTTKWASMYKDKLLKYSVFQHKTPLLRKLSQVEMWMQYNKITNLEIATKRLNKIIIKPGETFSYWRLIGRPTRTKGYLEGMVLYNGKVESGVGGGLCQLSNLIYWMTLHTPLTVTERYRHSYDVFPDSNRTVPFGSGATCAYNYIDLQIYNGTKQTYQLLVYLTDDYLVGEWRSDNEPCHTYEVYQGDHWITHEPGIGYVRHNTIYRKVYNLKGEDIDDEFVTENHAIMMYQPYLEQGD
ncbi:VanW family protein [Natranaerobius thermophilus]|uniref:VanW family protein n=1 Tax=Natranaerobius thermophilus (strain ATCC BAA-1301 / DSM 18059 / JW/NM-WN-LF) TaxID=457570 RepID=B2A6R0_NATTJ|nr:VanW family protein [Natranaerobius thermophilus]ACB84193.1 VanW family protein [Natranaerobius thermophilus JW/NM-WN-LF]